MTFRIIIIDGFLIIFRERQPSNIIFMLQSTHKMAKLNQNEICAVLCLKRQYKQHDGEEWLCEILHIACLLNSENPIQHELKPSFNMYC